MEIFHRLLIAPKITPQMTQPSVSDDDMMDILHRFNHRHIYQRQSAHKPL